MECDDFGRSAFGLARRNNRPDLDQRKIDEGLGRLAVEMPGREPALARARQPEQGDGRDAQQRQKPDPRSGPKPSLRPARRRKHWGGETGRATVRERGVQYVLTYVVVGTNKKKKLI